MAIDESLKINSHKVVHETIDGEVVIVNLEKGYYYSLVKVGADIWSKIETGYSRRDMLEYAIAQYDGNPQEIENYLDDLLKKLITEEIIIVDELLSSNSSKFSISEQNSEPEKLKFEPPILEKYVDMQDLLLLDPIHEVDERGWPNVK